MASSVNIVLSVLAVLLLSENNAIVQATRYKEMDLAKAMVPDGVQHKEIFLHNSTLSAQENGAMEMKYGGRRINCQTSCRMRCKAADFNQRCLRACGTCCERCNCVPPGTSGHTEVCPCYANMRTHGNRLKCP